MPFPSPGDLPNPGIDLPNPGTEPTSLSFPALAGGFFTTNATWEALQEAKATIKQHVTPWSVVSDAKVTLSTKAE